MLYSHGAILTIGADPVVRNVVKRTSVLRSGLLIHRFGGDKWATSPQEDASTAFRVLLAHFTSLRSFKSWSGR